MSSPETPGFTSGAAPRKIASDAAAPTLAKSQQPIFSRLLGLRRLRLRRGSGLGFVFLSAFFLPGSEDGVQRIAFLARAELDDAFALDVLDETFEDLAAEVGARHLATAEEDGGFHLVSFVEKAQHVVLLRFVIVVVHVDAELDFLDHDLLLMLLSLAFLFFLLVEELAVVHDPANGRIGCGRDLYQVQVFLAGHLERFEGRQDADLIAFVVNHPDFAGTYAVVGADKPFLDAALPTVPAETRVEDYSTRKWGGVVWRTGCTVLHRSPCYAPGAICFLSGGQDESPPALGRRRGGSQERAGD